LIGKGGFLFHANLAGARLAAKHLPLDMTIVPIIFTVPAERWPEDLALHLEKVIEERLVLPGASVARALGLLDMNPAKKTQVRTRIRLRLHLLIALVTELAELFLKTVHPALLDLLVRLHGSVWSAVVVVELREEIHDIELLPDASEPILEATGLLPEDSKNEVSRMDPVDVSFLADGYGNDVHQGLLDDPEAKPLRVLEVLPSSSLKGDKAELPILHDNVTVKPMTSVDDGAPLAFLQGMGNREISELAELLAFQPVFSLDFPHCLHGFLVFRV
jgi:hypothetical protein